MTLADRVRRAAHERVGRRGAALFGFAVADIIYGASMLSASGVQQNATFRWFATIAPLPLWSGLWILVGAICAAGVVYGIVDVRSSRYWAFAAAWLIKAWWVIMCFWGWVSGEVSLGAVGTWFGLAYFVALFAGWREPDPPSKNAG